MPTKHPNRRSLTPRKNDSCCLCRCLCPDRFRVSRVDESNYAISRNAREYCPDCWVTPYPEDKEKPAYLALKARWIAYLRSKI